MIPIIFKPLAGLPTGTTRRPFHVWTSPHVILELGIFIYTKRDMTENTEKQKEQGNIKEFKRLKDIDLDLL